MEKGLTAQLINRVTETPRQYWVTSLRARKSTFNNMGITINHTSVATGKFTLAISSEPMRWNVALKKCPRPMPARMHKNTQTLK